MPRVYHRPNRYQKYCLPVPGRFLFVDEASQARQKYRKVDLSGSSQCLRGDAPAHRPLDARRAIHGTVDNPTFVGLVSAVYALPAHVLLAAADDLMLGDTASWSAADVTADLQRLVGPAPPTCIHPAPACSSVCLARGVSTPSFSTQPQPELDAYLDEVADWVTEAGDGSSRQGADALMRIWQGADASSIGSVPVPAPAPAPAPVPAPGPDPLDGDDLLALIETLAGYI